MDRKPAFSKLFDFALELMEKLDSELSEVEKNEAGSESKWSVKDKIAHVAAWIEKNLEYLEITDGVVPAIPPDQLDEENRRLFERYKASTWSEVTGFFRRVFDGARERLAAMTEEDLDRIQKRSDGSERSVWRALAGNAGMHMSMHFTRILKNRGDLDGATLLEERAAEIYSGIDDGPVWRGTVRYNLACHYALIGETAKAVAILGESFRMNPDLIEWSKKDPDFDGIRGDAAFLALYEE